jgi:putative endopeptidase
MPSSHTCRARFVTLALSMLIACLAHQLAIGQVSPLAYRGVDPKAIDQSVTPVKDLYRFANGKWLDSTSIPNDKASWSVNEEVDERNFAILREILESAAKDVKAKKGSIRRMIGDLYASAMDTSQIERKGLKPLRDHLRQIDSVRNPSDVTKCISVLNERLVFPMFGVSFEPHPTDVEQTIVWIGEAALGLPDREYYLDRDDKAERIRGEYAQHVERVFVLGGTSLEEARRASRSVLDIETRLARTFYDKVIKRDPRTLVHLMSTKDAGRLVAATPFAGYLKGIRARGVDIINVANPAALKEAAKVLSEEPIPNLRLYLRWNLLHAFGPDLNSEFEQEHFQFYRRVLRGEQEIEPRWLRAMRTVDVLMGEALGQLFVERTFPPSAKAKVTEMVSNVIAGLRERLTTLEWMSGATKEQALRKLSTMRMKIGYPDKWRDYARLRIKRDDYAGNVERWRIFEFRRQMSKVGRPRDRNEWFLTPQTFNAYYDPTANEIVLPAGILQPPMFDLAADDAANYGNTGASIGHEITHAFDDVGRRYDADGNLKDWWSPGDAERFNARTIPIIKQYDNYV